MGGHLAESLEGCGVQDYYHQGRPKSASATMAPYICDNINASDYMDITFESTCVNVTGKTEGAGQDNPRSWKEAPHPELPSP